MKRGEPSPGEAMLNALADVRAVLDDYTGTDWGYTIPAQKIDEIVHLAYARARMDSEKRDRRPARWLARVVGTSFPRAIAWRRGMESVTAICFEVHITDGTKESAGRKVEVRLSSQDAEILGKSLVGMAEYSKDMPQPTTFLEELLPGGSVKEENET
jgi:hypothetical protein